VSPPSHCPGALLYRFLFITQCGNTVYIGIAQVTRHPPGTFENSNFHFHIYILYMSSGDATFWSPWAPVLRANVKSAQSHPVTWRKVEMLSELACYKQVLASVLRRMRFELPLSLTSSMLGGQLPFAASLRAAKAS